MAANEPGKSLADALEALARSTPLRAVLGAPSGKAAYRKINFKLVKGRYQAELLTETQAFHRNIDPEGLAAFLLEQMNGGLAQLNAWDESGREHSVKLTKKGGVLTRKASSKSLPKAEDSHNRQKQYLIPEGEPLPPLVDMGVFTAEGRVAASMYDKFRQVNRFLEIIDDVYRNDDRPAIRAVDFGCGKSYLTFLLYHYFSCIRGKKTEILGLDLKEDVIASCNEAAKRYGYDGLTFQTGDIAAFTGGQGADMLISLHACDTATDYALFNALKNDIPAIFAVPCCQHELNSQGKAQTLRILDRYGIVKERVSAALTDAIRGNLLTCMGYKTQLLEFVDFSHTPKNIMLRAVKTNIPRKNKQEALEEVMAVVNELGVEPTLLRLLNDAKMLQICN